MKALCAACGQVVKLQDGIFRDEGDNTIEYRYECPHCGYRGNEFSWEYGGEIYYSDALMAESQSERGNEHD